MSAKDNKFAKNYASQLLDRRHLDRRLSLKRTKRKSKYKSNANESRFSIGQRARLAKRTVCPRSPSPAVDFGSTSPSNHSPLPTCFSPAISHPDLFCFPPQSHDTYSQTSHHSDPAARHCSLFCPPHRCSLPSSSCVTCSPDCVNLCTSNHLGSPCSYQTNLSFISQPNHEPTDHRTSCSGPTSSHQSFVCETCGLPCTDLPHNCIDRLRRLLQRQQAHMISLANCNRLNDRNVIDHEKTDQFAFVHYLDEQMDLVVKLKMTDQLRTCDLLQHAVQHFKLNDTHFESSHSNSFSVHDSSTYQLISLGSYRFEPGAIITQRNRFFVPTNRNLHFCLLPKRISINLLLNFDTQHRGTSSIETPSQNKWLSIQINPIASVADLKQHVCQLFSVDWSRCWISFRFVQLADHYSLFTVGISNNDHLIVHRV